MNIVEILDELGITHASSGESKDVRHGKVGIACPFCGRGERSLAVFPRMSTCWRCGKHSTAWALTEASGRPFGEVKQLLGEVVDLGYEPPKRGRLREPDGIGPLLPAHRRYLEGRGFDPDELIAVWGIKGIGLAAKLAWRVYIPVFDRAGVQVSWTTRSLDDSPRGKPWRYVGARPEHEDVAIKSLLYGEHLAGHAIIVTEGPTGPWRFGAGCVATLGADWTKAQANLIAAHPKRLVLFDSEDAAQQRADELCHAIKNAPGRTARHVLVSGTDPGDADQAEIDEIRAFLR